VITLLSLVNERVVEGYLRIMSTLDNVVAFTNDGHDITIGENGQLTFLTVNGEDGEDGINNTCTLGVGDGTSGRDSQDFYFENNGIIYVNGLLTIKSGAGGNGGRGGRRTGANSCKYGGDGGDGGNGGKVVVQGDGKIIGEIGGNLNIVAGSGGYGEYGGSSNNFTPGITTYGGDGGKGGAGGEICLGGDAIIAKEGLSSGVISSGSGGKGGGTRGSFAHGSGGLESVGGDGGDAGAGGRVTVMVNTIDIQKNVLFSIVSGDGGGGGSNGEAEVSLSGGGIAVSNGGDGGRGGLGGGVSLESNVEIVLGTNAIFTIISGRGGGEQTLLSLDDFDTSSEISNVIDSLDGFGGLSREAPVSGGTTFSRNGDGGNSKSGGKILLGGKVIIKNEATLNITTGDGGFGGVSSQLGSYPPLDPIFIGNDNLGSDGGNGGNGGQIQIPSYGGIRAESGGYLRMCTGNGGAGGRGGKTSDWGAGHLGQGGSGGNGGQILVNEEAEFEISKNSLVTLQCGDAGDGGAGGPVVNTGTSSLGGHGGAGGEIRMTFLSTGKNVFLTILPGDGSDGGDGGTGSSTGLGGNGAVGGQAIIPSGISLGKNSLFQMVGAIAGSVGTTNGAAGGVAGAQGKVILSELFLELATLTSNLTLNGPLYIKENKEIYGNGNTITLGSNGEIILQPGVSLLLDDVEIIGLDGTNVRSLDLTSTITLNNATLTLTDDYEFSTGTILAYGDSEINGQHHDFEFKGDALITVTHDTILKLSNIDSFDYNRASASAISLEDVSSTLGLNNTRFLSTQNVTLATGILQTEGASILDGTPGTIALGGLDSINIIDGVITIGNITN